MPGANHDLPHLPPRLLDAEALADRLSVTVPAVRAMVKRRQVPAQSVIRLGRRLRFDEEAINRWIEWLRADAAEQAVKTPTQGERA